MQKRLKKKKRSDSDDDDFDSPILSKSISAPVKKSTLPKKIKQEKKPFNSNLQPPNEPQQPRPQDLSVKKIVLEPWNKDKLDKLFSLVLSQANNAQFLTILRNLLSGYKHTLDAKKKEIKKKWAQLGNSSLRRDQYIRRQQEMKRMQEDDIREIKQDVIHRLGCCKTKGFQTKQQIIQQYKAQHPGFTTYLLDQDDYQNRKQDQIQLLELLMKQPDFVLESSTSNLMQFTFASRLNKPYEQIKQIRERAEIETDNMLNKFDNEENAAVQFLFMKQFANINYDKIFDNYDTCFKIREHEQFLMSKKSLSWLLDSKSDEIYSNEKFQMETFTKYSNILKGILSDTLKAEEVNPETRELLIEVCAYTLNSVHYSQKFKLKGTILHPLDILYVVEKMRAVHGIPGRDGAGGHGGTGGGTGGNWR